MLRVLLNYFLPFVLGSLCGLAAFYLLTPYDVPAVQNSSAWGSGSGAGGACRGRKADQWAGSESFEPEGANTPIRITSKPRATYTDLARQNDTEGSVLLKVTLLASGEVGSVEVVRSLPDGLTERAVAAARQIEFVPKKVNGVPVSVTRTVEYTFEIY